MTAAYLPSILVPIIGIIFPGFVMAFAFIYIEQDEIARFRQVSESSPVIQVESESPLVNQRLKQKVNANNIVPFARKAAPVAA